ncbi:HNH endonuclease [Breznakiellaceae bacterium SP9]
MKLTELKEKFPGQDWTPRASGIEIKDEYLPELLKLWEQLVAEAQKSIRQNFVAVNDFLEGDKQKKLLSYYERNPAAREKAIAEHGYACMVCGKKMEDIYGEIGKDFIHVHHIDFLSNYTSEHTVDPLQDMASVCPNCHAMLHRKKQDGNYPSIDELKKVVNSGQ